MSKTSPPPPGSARCASAPSVRSFCEVVQAAVLNGAALPPGFHSDRELVLEVPTLPSTSLPHPPHFLSLSFTCVHVAIPSGALSEAVRLDGMALELASKELRDDEEAGWRWSRGLGSARITSESRW